jgi:hypothetical protein
MATSAQPEYLYSFAEDLFRLGNATSPRLDHVRDTDVDTLERNGIQMVIANGKGISLFNLEELNRRKSRLNGWVWKIPQGTQPPSGLAIRPDPKSPGHFFLCPVSDMTMEKYRALLSKLVRYGVRTQKI